MGQDRLRIRGLTREVALDARLVGRDGEHAQILAGVTLDAHSAFSGDRAFFEHLFAAFPDATATLHELIGEKNWLAYRLTQPGTHQGEFMEIPATGRRAEWDVIGTVRVDDGKFVEHHAHPDTISLM